MKELENVTDKRKEDANIFSQEMEKLKVKNQALQKKVLSLGTQRMRDRSNDRLKAFMENQQFKHSSTPESTLMMRNKQLRDEIEKVHVRLNFQL